jgi:hypothetical protein
MRFPFQKSAVSSLNPASMFLSLHSTLYKISQSKRLTFTRNPKHYLFLCNYQSELAADGPLEFEAEICKVALLNLHAVRMKRIQGDRFLFKEVYQHIIQSLAWQGVQ